MSHNVFPSGGRRQLVIIPLVGEPILVAQCVFSKQGRRQLVVIPWVGAISGVP